MGKYLKKFVNHTGHQDYIDNNNDTPSVSVCIENNDICFRGTYGETIIDGKQGVFVAGYGVSSVVQNGSNATVFGNNAVAEGTSTTNAIERGITSASTNKAIIAEWSASTPDTDKFSVAKGEYSHAEGQHTFARNQSEHTQGQYNVSHKISGTYFGNAANTIHSIGIGTANNARKNAFEVMQNGDIYIYGKGGYDDTNAGQSGVKTLQQLLSDAGIA